MSSTNSTKITISRSGAITLVVILLLLLLMIGFIAYRLLNPVVTVDVPLGNAFTPSDQSLPFTNLAGEEIELTENFGSYVLVYSWASWCPQCSSDLPKLDSLVDDLLVEESDLKILAINRAEDTFTAQRFLNSIAPLVNAEVVLDPSDQLFKSVEGYAMPEVLLFDRDGTIIYQGRGALDEEELKRLLESLDS